MPYARQITRSHPTAILYLIDQSSSMNEKFGSDAHSKAQKVAEIVNTHLYSLTMRCKRDDGIREYFYVGILGYGAKVDSAFSGDLSGDLIPINIIADKPLRVEEILETVQGRESYTRKRVMPIWIEAVGENGTPMAEAFSRAEVIIMEWLKGHEDSFPPIIFNITDAEFNEGGDPAPICDRIKDMKTLDGNVIVFNICITGTGASPKFFPSPGDKLSSDWERKLLEMSSILPEFMGASADDNGFDPAKNGRCFVLNADSDAVSSALNVGTPVDLVSGSR